MLCHLKHNRKTQYTELLIAVGIIRKKKIGISHDCRNALQKACFIMLKERKEKSV